jgi:hypothetical protein
MAPKARPPSEIHVEPSATGHWVVCYAHGRPPLSDHLTASDAAACAQRRARTEGIQRVILHDCYTRVHEVPVSA